MRLPGHHRNGHERLDVKMTPMIDVIFLLLIFFVCTASFQAIENVLPTNLALSGSIESAEPVDPELLDLDEIVVKVLWMEGAIGWEINGRRYQRLDEVAAVLKAVADLRRDLPVILDVDGRVSIENVLDVYDRCRQIGLERVQFAASADLGNQ